VTIQDSVNGEQPVTVPIEIEPTLVGLGPYHLATAMNNRVWFYVLAPGGTLTLQLFLSTHTAPTRFHLCFYIYIYVFLLST